MSPECHQSSNFACHERVSSAVPVGLIPASTPALVWMASVGEETGP